MRPLHICFAAPYVWPVLAKDAGIEWVGGAEVQQSVLARGFVRAGHRVTIVCLDFGQPARVEIDGITVLKSHREEGGVPVLRFVHPRLTSTWRALSEADADVYYQRSSAMLTAVVAAFARRRGRSSVYAAASDVDFAPGRQPIRYARDRRLFEWGLANVDRIVVQNAQQARDCLENYGRPSTLIPSAYELPASARPGGGEFVLWVGVTRRPKRAELFLELARRLPHRRFVLIGGPDAGAQGAAHHEALRASAAALPNVLMTGFQALDRVEPWFDRARLLVNTSQYEGMPNTFLQAWARGVPTVAFIDPGSRLDGQPLYPPLEGVEDMAAEVERLFTDPAHHAAAGARCLNHFRATHSLDAVVARYEQVFRSLAAPGAADLGTVPR